MMRRARAVGLMTVVGALVAAGCNDPNKKADNQNAMMEKEQQIQQLQDELARLQAEQAGQIERLSALESENSKLKSELASAPKADGEWKAIPGGAMISLDAQILFDSGKNVLKTTGKSKLTQIASTIQTKYAGYDVYVIGHTDNEPIRHSRWQDNFELSAQRALSVVRYLKSQGIAPDKLAAVGRGEFRPIASNASATERSLNRRVEIYAMAPQPKGAAPVAKSGSAAP